MRAAYRTANSDTLAALRDVGIANERARVDSTLITFHVCRLMAFLEDAIKIHIGALQKQDSKVLGSEVTTFKLGDALLTGLGDTYKAKLCALLSSVHTRIVRRALRR